MSTPTLTTTEHASEQETDPVTGRPFAHHPDGDGPAQPLLIEVMVAAGRHDRDECLRLLDAAEVFLGTGFHKSRSDISAARGKARDLDWVQVWHLAYAATTGLTWAWAPDPAVCPPLPVATPYADVTACICGAELARQARFCSMCGTPRPTVDPSA